MCGICGKLVFNENYLDKAVIKKMMDSLKHRGPDDEGIYLSEAQNSKQGIIRIGLGHRRLKIIDLSNNARQPMMNEDGNVVIVYNGEIYNFKELRVELEKNGHIFRSNSDTEVIVHLYEESGVDCVKQLRGMFAFAIWDQRNKRLFLARDRLGVKPLNYTVGQNSFLFASELSALLEDPSVPREPDLASLNDYLAFQYIPAPNTIFKGVYKLPPAHTLIWQDGKITISRYWNLSYGKKIKIHESEYCQNLLDLFTDSVKVRMISDVPLGVFLSGGIDSSAVTAVMSRLSGKPVRTFSIGFEDKSFDELRYARLVAEYFNTEHEEHIIKPDALKVLPELIERFGEPFADSASIPAYYLSKICRVNITVALSGDAGDELFAGYDRYVANKLAVYYCNLPNFFRKNIFMAYLLRKLPETTAKKDLVHRIRRFITADYRSPEKRYAYWMSLFNNELKESLYSSEFKNQLKDIDSNAYLLDVYRQSTTGDFIDSMLFVDMMTYLPNDLLVKADITSMANSLEVRSPFLDHKLVDFSAAIPSGLKLRGLHTKYILKKALGGVLPKKILARKKAGFGVPVGNWFRNELKGYAYEILLTSRCVKGGYFLKGAVKKILDEHSSGMRDYGDHIWSLLNLELWYRRFISH